MTDRLRAILPLLLLVSSALLLGLSPLAAQLPDEDGVTAPVVATPPQPAQVSPPQPAQQVKEEIDAPKDDDASGPRVLCAFNPRPRGAPSTETRVDNHGCPDSTADRTLHLGNRLSVRVGGLEPFLAEKSKTYDDLRLFLDGVELTGLEKEAVQIPSHEDGTTVTELRFELRRTPENRDDWRTLLGPFTLDARTTTAGVGLAGEVEIPGSSNVDIELRPVHTGWLTFYVALLAVLLLVFFRGRVPNGGKLTDSLRDRYAEVSAGQKKPFSLARCQMAWWFFLVLAAYVFLWLVLGDLDTLTGSVLTLMGIGSGTALGAAMVDANKVSEKENAEAEEAAAKAAGDTARAQLATSKLKDLQQAVKKGHSSFLTDLLSDKNGPSFHRFQIAVWTVVLGIIFVSSVLKELAMPQFSETLLGLMGISSGTYLGFKIPEKHG